MAAPTSSFFTLTGFLELLVVKPKARKDRRHRYWFMFDESKRELRYFEKHTDDLHNPVGSIPMSNARLSLSVQGREEGVRTVVVSVENSEYHLIAPSGRDAQYWYRKIQEKTEASRKLANQTSARSASQRPQSFQEPARSNTSRFSLMFPTLSPPRLPMKESKSFVEGTDCGGAEYSSLDRPGLKRSTLQRSLSAEDVLCTEEDSSSTPPVAQLLPGAASINADTPSAVILPQTIDQLPADDSPASEPPPLPPKSSYWNTSATDASAVMEDARPPYFKIQPSPKPASLDLKQAVSISTKQVYYNVVPEYPIKGKLQSEADYVKKVDHLEQQLEVERTVACELRDILDRLTKNDPAVNATRWQNALDELKELRQTNAERENVIATLNEEQTRSQESQRQFDSKMEEEQERYHKLELEMNRWKALYIKRLGSQLEIPIGNLGFGPSVAAPTLDEQEQRREVEQMLRADCLEEEIGNLFSGPGTLSDFHDEFGDTYYAENDSLTYHFLVRRLYRLYTEDEVEELSTVWDEFCSKQAGKEYLDLSSDKKREEVRQLLWKGLPMTNKCRNSRVKLWESCIHRLMGEKKRYLDEQQNNKTYYQNLLDLAESQENPHSKQIVLDLPRTLPYNIHFKPETDAVSKMSNILHAFCQHAPKIGYTQGMNLLVAISLFHLDEESTFWCLVAILEKILPEDYYTHGLLASQADQAVFQSLVEKEMPELTRHMRRHGIDVTLVSLNWFLTIFVDALPTEAVIRIWDLFLLDGRPVLFCFALALLRMHEAKLKQMHDAVNLLQFLKNMSRHTFDVELMFQVVQQTYRTVKLNAFINKRFDDYLRKLKIEFQKRERERREVEELARQKMEKFEQMALEAARRKEDEARQEEGLHELPSPDVCIPDVHQRVFTVGSYFRRETPFSENPKWLASCACKSNEVWLALQYPNDEISTVSVSVGASIRMTPIEAKLSKKSTTMHYHSPSGLVLVGTLDFKLIAFSHQSSCELWSYIMKDSILDITSLGSSVFVGLADASVAKLSNVNECQPQLAPELLTVSTDTRNNAVQSIVAVEWDNTIWCATGSAITIVDAAKMQQLESLDTGMLQRNPVSHLCISQYGVWATYRFSTMVSLYSIDDHSRLFHMDYKTAVYRKEVPDPSEATGLDLRITAFLINGEYVWIGTGGGSVILFKIVRQTRLKKQQLERKTVSSSAVVPWHRMRARSTLPGLLMQDPLGETDAASAHLLTADKGVKVGEPQGGISSHPDSVPTLTRRKTASLRTVCTSNSAAAIKEEDSNMYTLDFVLSSSIAKSADHVRKLLAFNSDRARRVMTCVRASNDETNPIQIWNCDQDDPQKWFSRPLDC